MSKFKPIYVRCHSFQYFFLNSSLTDTIWLLGKKTNGNWYWADGTSWTYTNWANGRPMAGSSYNALVLTSHDRLWYDVKDYYTYYTALCQCEFDPPMH